MNCACGDGTGPSKLDLWLQIESRSPGPEMCVPITGSLEPEVLNPKPKPCFFVTEISQSERRPEAAAVSSTRVPQGIPRFPRVHTNCCESWCLLPLILLPLLILLRRRRRLLLLLRLLLLVLLLLLQLLLLLILLSATATATATAPAATTTST